MAKLLGNEVDGLCVPKQRLHAHVAIRQQHRIEQYWRRVLEAGRRLDGYSVGCFDPAEPRCDHHGHRTRRMQRGLCR